MNINFLYLLLILLVGISFGLWFLLIKAKKKQFSQLELHDLLQTEKDKVRKDLEKKSEQDYQQKIQKAELEAQKYQIQAQQQIQDEEKKLRNYEIDFQHRLTKKEEQLEQSQYNIDSQKKRLEEDKNLLSQAQVDLKQKQLQLDDLQNKIDTEINTKLERIAGFTREQAAQEIMDKTKLLIGYDMTLLQSKMLEQAEDTANIQARNIVSLAIQRCSSEVANEMTVTVVKLNSDEDKGKLIGKGGRNIQWLEKTLGVEMIIDDTPEVVTISGFSGIRRHIAKRTVEKLLDDGRVHPSSIEEMYEKAKSEISMEVQDAGEEVVAELGIVDFSPKLIRILGRLKFRTSYGQNMLKHSLEMAKLAGLLVDEINMTFTSKFPINRDICVKGALLHDIGKAVDEEQLPKGNHIELGEKICDMFGLDWRIKKCVSSHHETGGDFQSYHDLVNGFCIEACVVDACDNISGSRPGARKETAEAYYQRMEALERIANNIKGVQKSFIMRGSRELWVFFDPATTELAEVADATRQIVNQINDSIKSPFKIQVNAFLENRLVEYAG
jgi:ribonucrease Y